MASKIDNLLAFHHQALSLRAHRQQVLAGNIANSDTPNYKARDIDFASALKNAVAGRSGEGVALARTSDRHISAGAGGGPAPLLYRKETQASVDGNTVNMDVERSQFAENAIFYEAGVSFISGKLKTLMSAVQGQ
ncbi:MAG: flagellar basal body rod protein FlgB [Sterolibacterium sp.]